MTAISVVLPFRDASRYLSDALESILTQDVRDIEVLAIDDGSTDASVRIVGSLAGRDPRVRLLQSKAPGLPAALNTGIAAARSLYIARMDADDVALPGRFAAQLKALAADEQTAVVGTAAELIDAGGRPLETTWYPTESDAIRAALMGGRCCLCHPSVMMRAAAVRAVGGYRTVVPLTEDFDLWLRLSQVWKLRNLDRPFIKYRLHERSAAFARTTEQLTSFLRALVLAQGLHESDAAAMDAAALLARYAPPGRRASALADLAAWYVENAVVLGNAGLARLSASLIAGVASPSDRDTISSLLSSVAALRTRASWGVVAASRYLAASGSFRTADRLLWKAILVPVRVDVVQHRPASTTASSDGYLDAIHLFDNRSVVVLFGWTRTLSTLRPALLRAQAPGSAQIQAFRRVVRQDVAETVGAELLYSGFRIEMRLDRPFAEDDSISLWAREDGDTWRPITNVANSLGA